MSLISEALKKAQRMRTSESATGGNGYAGRRGRPTTSPLLVWVVAGTAVFVSAAIVIVVFLLRPPAPALSTAKAAAAPPATAAAVSPPGALVSIPGNSLPAKPPAAATPKAEAPTPAIDEAALPPPKLPAAAKPAGASARPPPQAESGPAGAGRPDARIQDFVDSLKVAGIRSSGNDSKVLMNDHVYRVNDVVDRSLNLRLTGVQSDRLTFVDENGVVYTKSF
jgi:hypothetical protein